MAYPELKKEEIEKLQRCVGQEVVLTEWTAAPSELALLMQNFVQVVP